MSDLVSSTTYPVATIARLFGVSPRCVAALAQRNILPRASRGKFELQPVLHAYLAFLLEHERTGRTPATATHKNRMLEARARAAEREVKAMERDTLNRREVEAEWAAILRTIRARMLAIPDAVAAPAYAAKTATELSAIVAAEVHAALENCTQPNVIKTRIDTIKSTRKRKTIQ